VKLQRNDPTDLQNVTTQTANNALDVGLREEWAKFIYFGRLQK
jgi:hypothetical protein